MFRWLEIGWRRQLCILLWVHLLLVRVHVSVGLEGSRAERATVEIDSGVLGLMLDEIPLMLEHFVALIANKSGFSVHVRNVRLQAVLVLRDLAAMRARVAVRIGFDLLVPGHVHCETSFVLQEMSANLKSKE